MVYTILWTDNARECYAAIIEYMMQRYGTNSTLKMDDKVERLIELLAHNKHLCPPTETNLSVRRCVITKQLSLVYQINNSTIELIAFYDNRASLEF